MTDMLKLANCCKCGAKYRQNSHQQHYCSDACRLAKVCVRCGNEYLAGSNRNQFCSEACRFGEKACQQCGARFIPSKNSRGAYCSQPCFFAMRQALRKRACVHCGGEFFARNPATVQRFCGHSCARKAKAHAGWKRLPEGATSQEASGYVQVKVDGKWIPQHRHVVEQQLGRKLYPYERVHHINGVRSDNSIDNLELWTIQHPCGVRVKDLKDHHCPGCRCFEKRE